MSQKIELAKWKVVAGLILGLTGCFASAWGGRASASHTYEIHPQELTEDRIRIIFREEFGPLERRVSALESRTALNEAELATYRARLIPRLERIDRLTVAMATKMGLNLHLNEVEGQ